MKRGIKHDSVFNWYVVGGTVGVAMMSLFRIDGDDNE